MDAERYSKIDSLVEAALEMKPDERSSFLERACAGDADLRREVESLLDACHDAESFIETPAMEMAARSLAEDSSLSLRGKTVGRYQVMSLLGEGGMGEVHLALDAKMNRKVALKLLPVQFTQSPDRIARFQRESRAASALNHPNIVTTYEIGVDRGIHFIASEYIDGDTLRRRISRGKLSMKEALDITIQAASALAAAHAAGIIHRDIKPENVMVRRDGYVKVLDFGLVKLTELGGSDPNQSDVSHSTQSGTVLGTINYMSPEQALGQEMDSRTDIFSLGVVLYEMVTGQQPFKGATAASTFDAILNRPPAPVRSSSPDVSIELERIINRALEKDRDIRYQTASDLRAVLKRLQRNLDSGITASTDSAPTPSLLGARRLVSRWWMGAAIALGIVAVVVPVSLLVGQTLLTKSSADWLTATATKMTSSAAPEYFPSLSPDGKSLVYASRASGNYDIYLKRIGSRKTANLTEDSQAEETQPAFSPDGKRIAFRRRGGPDGGGIYLMTENGESARRLTDFGYNPAWSPDGKEIACTENLVETSNRSTIPSRLWIVNSATGASRNLAVGDAVQATWSPDGRRLAYWGVHKGSQRDIWTVAVNGGEPVQVTDDSFIDWNPVWSPDGEYLYFISNRQGVMSVWRVAIDQSTGRARKEPEPVPTPSSDTQHISFSSDGTRLAYVQASYIQRIEKLTFDPATEKIVGSTAEVIDSSGEVTSPSVSPDGQVLVCQSSGVHPDIISLKLGSPILNQLTDEDTNEMVPVWSPDGRRIAYYSNKSGAYQIWTINPDGSGAQEITGARAPGAVLPVWSPDGSRMAFSLFGSKTLIMDLKKPWKDQTPIETASSDSDGIGHFVAHSWSSDGKSLAGSGYQTLYVGLFAYSIEAQHYEQISAFGFAPKWLRDNRRLVFYNEDKVFLTDTQSKRPRELFSFAPDSLTGIDISRDNRSIYVSAASTEADIWVLSLESADR
jgi:serine/threonine protein kinase